MLIYLVFLIVCFGASIVGAICGIGGGVIIKPVLDSFGVLDVTAISFLSGCTVLSMTTYSVLKNKISGGITCYNENRISTGNRSSSWRIDRKMAVFLCKIFKQ